MKSNKNLSYPRFLFSKNSVSGKAQSSSSERGAELELKSASIEQLEETKSGLEGAVAELEKGKSEMEKEIEMLLKEKEKLEK